MRVALLLMLVACGKPRTELPKPNTELACDRAIACKAISESNFDPCMRCLERITPEMIAQIEATLGYKLPAFETVDCQTVRAVVTQYTNISDCVVFDWYRPKQ